VRPYGWDWGYWRHAVVPVLRELRSAGLGDALAVRQEALWERHRGAGAARVDSLTVRGSAGRRYMLDPRRERRGREPRDATVRVAVGAAADGLVEVLFEGRSVQVRGGVIEDRFAPHDVHVYQLPAQRRPETEAETGGRYVMSSRSPTSVPVARAAPAGSSTRPRAVKR
jgi:hypothetical protein